VAQEVRDAVVAFVAHYGPLTGLGTAPLLRWMPLSPRQFRRWKSRSGQANRHNALLPRDFWITIEERAAIVAFARQYPLEGYRRLTFMMLDCDVAAISPATTYRVLKDAAIIGVRLLPTTTKGQGFVQPLAPHAHWHVDFAYLNIGGTFYYLCTVLDGYSRAILAWDIRPQMKEADAEIVLQRARETFPHAKPRVITDRGAQFVARDFQEFIRLWQTTHVFCSPHYPQSNGKLERYHRTLKEQAIRPKTPLTLDDAKRIVADFIAHYNHVRLHSAIGYIAPADRLAGHDQNILAARTQKLAAARNLRKLTQRKQALL
jgi:transposase InsO family protein